MVGDQRNWNSTQGEDMTFGAAASSDEADIAEDLSNTLCRAFAEH